MSQVEMGTSRSGVPQLRRRWDAATPRAVMLIVHGLGEHSGRYEHVGAFFADHGIETHAFDLYGHGGSGGERMDVPSFETYLDDLAERLTAVRKEGLPLILYGHSLGGLIVLRYLESGREPQPDVAVFSAPALHGGAAWQRKLAGPLSRLAPRLAIPTAIKGEQLSRDPAVGEAYFADPLVQTKATARLGAELFTAMDQALSDLDRLRVPVLVIHGGADTLVPPTASLPLAELPTVTRTLYPRLRHEAHNEPEGQEVLQDVLAWIDRTLGETDDATQETSP